MAAAAAAALGFTLILPWYEKSFFATTGRGTVAVTDSLSAFQVFSFVEAAVLLVAAGVLYLVWARAQNKGFHLPGGDGTVIMGAGAWAVLLLVWRLFDKPDVDDPGATVGIQWGMFAALLAAGLLVAAGARVRAAHRPEPPEPGGRRRRLGAPRARRRAAPGAAPAGGDRGDRGVARPARLGGRAARGARPRRAPRRRGRARRAARRPRPPVLAVTPSRRAPAAAAGWRRRSSRSPITTSGRERYTCPVTPTRKPSAISAMNGTGDGENAKRTASTRRRT